MVTDDTVGPAVTDNTVITTPPRREWSPHTFFVPHEREVGKNLTAFATHDQTVYVRLKETGQIRRYNPKVRGKAARAADKLARRQKAK